MCAALVAKGLSATRQKTKEKVMETLLMYVEIEKQDVVQVRSVCGEERSPCLIDKVSSSFFASGGTSQGHASETAQGRHRIDSNDAGGFEVRRKR